MALGLPEDPAQQRRLLIGLIPIALLFGYWYFMYQGQVVELETMQTRLETLEMRNSQARMRAPQSQQLEERLATFERHVARLEQLVPRGEEVSRLLNQISERADQIGVSVARFQPAGTNAGAHYTRRTFEMTVQGEYHEIARFLTAIGSLPRIITPIGLTVIPYTPRGRRNEDEQMLEASFVIETYVLPEPGTGPANQAAGAGA
ncbi:MAG: type 4a pilus biogenesis protein PilO [Gemmatimonadota bacterium]|jgi:type IV pilus assembly protein PilO